MKKNQILKIQNFPFYTGMTYIKRKHKNTKSLPLSMFFDNKLAIPRLKLGKRLVEELKNTYRSGSMLSTPLGESLHSCNIMEEFITVLKKVYKKQLKGKDFVEIGCGNGALLNKIKQNGANVLGFEIGPQAKAGVKKYRLKILQKELSAHNFEKKVDAIFSYGTLEHVLDPLHFIDHSKKLLKPGGLFFHRIPNMSHTYKTCNIEDLCHEHVSYFSEQSCKKLFQSRGFERCGFKLSCSGKEVHVWGFASQKSKTFYPGDNYKFRASEEKKFLKFSHMIKKKTAKQIKSLNKLLNKKSTARIGMYAGGYILASLAGNPKKIRFFDGDEKKWGGRWLKHLNIIEAPRKLQKRCIDVLIICSDHYLSDILNDLANTYKVDKNIWIIPLSSL